MHHFDWSGIPGALPTLWTGAIVTLQITVIAIVVGIVWGTVLALMRLSAFKPLRVVREASTSRCSARSRW